LHQDRGGIDGYGKLVHLGDLFMALNDSEKPVESWASTLSVGSICSLIVGMVVGYLGFNYGTPTAIICFIFIGMNPSNTLTSRPFYRKAIVLAMIIVFGSLIGVIVQNLILWSH